MERGTPETLVQLRDVFVDPGVWNESSLRTMIPEAEKYAKRATVDADFAAKVRAAARVGLTEEEAGRSEYSGNGADDYRKQQAAQRAAQKKQLDQLFKAAPPLAEQLAEIVAMDETEALAALNTSGEAMMERPPVELEVAFFQAAAKAKSAAVKQQLIQGAMGAWMRASRGQPGAKAAAPLLCQRPPPRDRRCLRCSVTRRFPQICAAVAA